MWYGSTRSRLLTVLLLLAQISGASSSLMAQEQIPATEIRPLSPDKVVISLSQEELSPRMTLLIVYSIAIVLASIVGGYLPEKLRLTHTRLQILMSFVGGMMLGVALFHLLLHALLDSPRDELSTLMSSMALGILIMFLLLRAFHFHQHDVTPHVPGADQFSLSQSDHHHHDHDHDHDSESTACANVPVATQLFKSRYSWLGIALGLALHSVLDGVALTASLLNPAASSSDLPVWGLAAFLAILLHKPLDAISITSVMSASGWSRRMCTTVNVSFALMCPLGAFLAWWGIVGTHSHVVVISQLLAFSAGIFLCISLSDLLPEMQFHAHNQWTLTIALLAGLGLAWGLMFLNPVHQ